MSFLVIYTLKVYILAGSYYHILFKFRNFFKSSWKNNKCFQNVSFVNKVLYLIIYNCWIVLLKMGNILHKIAPSSEYSSGASSKVIAQSQAQSPHEIYLVIICSMLLFYFFKMDFIVICFAL